MEPRPSQSALQPWLQGLVKHRYRVVFGDTDQMGVVYYANYLKYFERGRVAYLRNAGFSYGDFQENGWQLPVVDVQAKYHKPARYEDLLEVETVMPVMGRVKMVFEYRIYRLEGPDQRILLCSGSSSHACMDENGRPTRLPKALTAHLTEYWSSANALEQTEVLEQL